MGPQARASFAEAETIGRRLDHGLKKRKQKKNKKKKEEEEEEEEEEENNDHEWSPFYVARRNRRIF